MSRIMTPHAANWYAGEQPWQTIYGLPLRLALDARRFDVSPTWFSALGAGLTLPWLASLDGAAVEAHTVGLASRLRAELGLPQSDSAIVSLPIEGAAEKLKNAGIRASVRAGAIRVGFHLYNIDNDLDRLLDALR
jgi:selenocysteine lyase/cysteine desulfurase